MQDYNFYKYLHVYTYSGRATLFIVQSYTAFNPRAGNDILHPYTGNGGGGKLPPRAFKVMMLASRERLKISTCGKNCLVWDTFFYDMHISCCSRDPSGIQDGRQYGRSMMK